jgi:hypothetical protein
MLVLAFSALIPALRADERTSRLIEGLTRQADTFQKITPEILGRETLQQRVLKPPPHFKPRIGEGARKPVEPGWRQRELVSEYGFAALGAGELHELRRVTSVDGRKVEDEKQAQESLARLVTATDDQRKRLALKQLEKYGLRGAAIDFGQILLLFSRSSIGRYEFSFASLRQENSIDLLVFRYRQLDGPAAMTVFDRDRPLKLRIAGEVWVRAADFAPVRITLHASETESEEGLREDATVQYLMSEYGVMLPASVEHQELRDGRLISDSKFTYANFHKFEATSNIKFAEEVP